MAKVQDEAGHGLYLYSACETLGVQTRRYHRRPAQRQSQVQQHLQLPHPEWADIGAVGWLVDGAAIMNQVRSASAVMVPMPGPWSACCKEESFHQRQGFQIMMTLAQGTEEQKAMAQDALNRWWWPSIMMFGPPDDNSPNSAQSMAWNIKRFSNDELRQKFIDLTVPQAELIGLTIPDADLKWNEETGHYEHGPIDWDEFNRVIAGHGPCNKERLGRPQQSLGRWRVGSRSCGRPCRETRCTKGRSQHGRSLNPNNVEKQHWPLWEIFIRSRQGLSHRHVGSLHAADAEMAIENARDVYTRRQEGVSIWAVPATNHGVLSRREGRPFRSRRRQGLPPPHFL